MAASIETERARTRVLGLGNEILADDAFGILAAREVEQRFPEQVEVVVSSGAGFALLDDVLGAARLLVIDTILTGGAEPGNIRVLTADEMQPAHAAGPHFLGLFEMLAAAKLLGLAVPKETVVIAVEAFDCTTVGGAMHPAVQAAIPGVVELVGRLLAGGPAGPAAPGEDG